MLYFVQFIFFGVVISVVFIIYKSFKEPKLTPKKVLVESLLVANEELLSIRKDVTGLIADIFDFQKSNKLNPVVINEAIEKKKLSVGRALASAEANVEEYKTLEAYKRFYNLVIAAIAAIRLSVSSVSEAQLGSTQIHAIIVQLLEVKELTLVNEMTLNVEDNDHHTAEKVDKQVKKIIKKLSLVKESLDAKSFQTEELKEIGEAIKIKLNQAEDEYTELHESLLTGRYNIYRLKRPRIPEFLSHFDLDSYKKLVVSIFSNTPEDDLVNELRTHLYN